MKKIIVLPRKYDEIREVYTDTFFELFRLLCEEFGFKFKFAESLEGIIADLFLVYAGVHGQRLIKDLATLSYNKKVILYIDGVHGLPHGDIEIEDALNRANCLLSGCDELFRETYPEFKHKFELFPHFFAPSSRYLSLQFNEKPLMRCLLTGNVRSPYHYPFRSWISSCVLQGKVGVQKVDIMRHPRWQAPSRGKCVVEGVMRDEYAKILNRYFCSLATSSRWGCALAKYFEIPATGALLLANDAPGVREVGLIANKHFVPIDETNVFDRINYCLANPKAYRNVRLEGMEYVRANHSVENRAERIGEILENL